MKLADYLKREGLTHQAFADQISSTQVAVTRYAGGLRIPERETMKRIVGVTGGAVTPNDFFDVAPPEPTETAA